MLEHCGITGGSHFAHQPWGTTIDAPSLEPFTVFLFTVGKELTFRMVSISISTIPALVVIPVASFSTRAMVSTFPVPHQTIHLAGHLKLWSHDHSTMTRYMVVFSISTAKIDQTNQRDDGC